MVMGYGCAKSGCWQYEAILPSAPAENPAAGILVNATVYYTTFIAVIMWSNGRKKAGRPPQEIYKNRNLDLDTL